MKKSIDTANVLHDMIVTNEEERRKLFFENVLMLSSLKKSKLYKDLLDPQTDRSWVSYLAQLEIYYSRWSIERWMKIYDKLIKELDIKVDTLRGIPETRLYELAIVSDKNNVDEWISRAKTATSLDWRNFLAENKGLPTTEECKHKNSKFYSICDDCGFRHKENFGEK